MILADAAFFFCENFYFLWFCHSDRLRDWRRFPLCLGLDFSNALGRSSRLALP